MTHSDPTHLPLPPPTSLIIVWLDFNVKIKLMGGWWVGGGGGGGGNQL